MKKLYVIAVMAMLATNPTSAIFDGQLGFGYNNASLSDNGGSLKVPDQNFKGFAINTSAHLNFSIASVFSLGAGPYLTYAPDMSYTYATSINGITFSNTQFAVGGEVQFKLLAIPVISPYAKIGYGVDTLKSTVSGNGLSAEAYKFSGNGYRALFGLDISIIGPLALFAEAGFTGMTYDLSSLGNSQPNYKTKGTTFILNFGVSFSL
jgi:Outer membrane protein beta-barrel domain